MNPLQVVVDDALQHFNADQDVGTGPGGKTTTVFKTALQTDVYVVTETYGHEHWTGVAVVRVGRLDNPHQMPGGWLVELSTAHPDELRKLLDYVKGSY